MSRANAEFVPYARCLPVHHGSGIGIGIEYRDLSGIGRIGRPSPSREPPGGRDARSGRRGSHRLWDGKAYPRSGVPLR